MRRGRRCSSATAQCAEGKLCGHSTIYLGPSLTPTLRLLPIKDWGSKTPEGLESRQSSNHNPRWHLRDSGSTHICLGSGGGDGRPSDSAGRLAPATMSITRQSAKGG